MSPAAEVRGITTAEFDSEVTDTPGVVLVDFWAEWCGPCKMMEPVVRWVAEEYVGRVKVLKVNVDDEPEVAARFAIRSIPSFLIFRDGAVIKSLVGARGRNEFASALDSLLA